MKITIKSIHRTISLVLALCMLIAVFPPTISMAGENELEIVFSESVMDWGIGRIVSGPHFTTDLSKSTTGSQTFITYPNSGRTLFIDIRGLYGGFWPQTAANYLNWFTIDIAVPTAGNYTLSYEGIMLDYGTTMAFYMDGIYLGDYDSYDQAAKTAATTYIGPKKRMNSISLSAGTHKLSMRSWGSRNPYNDGRLLPYRLWLTPNDTAPELSSISENIPAKIAKTDTFDLSVRAMMTNGDPFRFGLKDDGTADTLNILSIRSLNSDLLEVKNFVSVAPGKDGVSTATLLAKNEGTAQVVIEATVNGITKSIQKSVLVSPPPTFDTVNMTVEKTALMQGNQTSAATRAFLSNGVEINIADTTLSYSSSNASIAEVDPQSGVITAKSQGKANIIATVTYQGITNSSSVEITVLPPPALDFIRLKSDKTRILLGETALASVEAVMDDQSILSPSSYSVSYSVDNPEIASITQQGTIAANQLGRTTIRATVTSGNIVKNASMDITVVEGAQQILIDFSKTTTQYINNKWQGVATPGYTIDRTKSSNTNERIYSVGGSPVLTVDVRGLYNQFWPKDATNFLNHFTIKVNVPVAGYYTMGLQGGIWDWGTKASIYADEIYMGDYDFYQQGASSSDNTWHVGTSKQLNAMYFTEGEHSITFRSREAFCDNPFLLLYKLWLTPSKTAPVLNAIEADLDEKYVINETITANIKAMLSNGFPYSFGLTSQGTADTVNTISVTNLTPSVVSLSNVKSGTIGRSETTFATIKMNSIGIANLKVTAKVGGVTMDKIFTFEITNERLSSVGASLMSEEVFVGDQVKIIPINTLNSGRIMNNSRVNTTYQSETPNILSVNGDLLTARAIGQGRVKITSSFNGDTVIGYMDVTIYSESMTKVDVTVGGSKYIKLSDTSPRLFVKAISNMGNEIDSSGAQITYSSLSPDIATVDGTGAVHVNKEGDAKFKVAVTINGRTKETTATFPVIIGKTQPTMMTYEMRQNIIENGRLYAWANSTIQNEIAAADKYLFYSDRLWDMVTSEGIPRSASVGLDGDPDMFTCRYCKTDLRAKYGSYSWIVNPLSDPWKIKCPNCLRRFPTNDFEGYYKLGLDEYGRFNQTLAQRRNAELVAAGKDGYLKNILYPEMGENWGVDDGRGYVPLDGNGNPKKYPNGIPEMHTYIAYYLHWGIWWKNAPNGGVVSDAIRRFGNAYAYTGDIKYGRAGAILIDRLADFYPGYNLYKESTIKYFNSCGGTHRGKMIGCIWECGLSGNMAYAYDLLYPAFDDPSVVSYLNNKSKQVKMTHAKENPAQIRNNVEDGLLREIYKAVYNLEISGNFGYHQQSVIYAALALDTMPDTGEMLDWLMRDETAPFAYPCVGGNINSQLMDVIDRDGMGSEASAYNIDWLNMLILIADELNGYDKYPSADLYKNPKFKKMFDAFLPLTLCSYFSPQIGDSSSTASKGIWMTEAMAKKAFLNFGDPKYAQIIYLLNGDKVDGLKTDIKAKDPEKIQQDVLEVIRTHGTIKLESEMMTGFGFGVLRDGEKYHSDGVNNSIDNQRDFWMYFGKNWGHGHKDNLNLGIEAYGLNMAPDLGYPEQATTQPNTLQWVTSTLSHNTVMVDEVQQKNVENGGYPMHFDGDGQVKVMDVDSPKANESTNIFRRTVVMIDASDDVSYGIDFFRVLGGNDHVYSFHSQSDEIYQTEGLSLTPQADSNGNYIGSYAGPTIPKGPDPNSPEAWWYDTVYPRGYTWLDKVNRDASPSNTFAIDFKVKDFNNVLNSNPNLHLRMTMLSGDIVDEVAIANGYAPNKVENSRIPNLKYALIKRTGSNLDSLFTTVYEPYKDQRYIQSIEKCGLTLVDGTPETKDVAYAVKVTFANSRVDYVVYATNNTLTYRIDDTFDFRGFVGVYRLVNGDCIYQYLNDGDILGSKENSLGTASVSGKVFDFTKELSENNTITITPSQSIDASALSGKYIFIDNDKVENGAYKIHGATAIENGRIRLNIGDVTLVRKYSRGATNDEFIYNIESGQNFRIPLTIELENAPIFNEVKRQYVEATSKIELQINARSPIGRPITYVAKTLPRGANFDANTAILTWTPEATQQGDYHVAVEASDGSQSTILHFTITVTSPSGTAGGGAPGSTPTPDPDPDPDPEVPQQAFIDLDGYEWAEEAINHLADQGIIQGTSVNTFSPRSNIKRGDFVLLLVRALNLSEGNESKILTFDDVNDQYYADAIHIAASLGFITGYKGKFNPEDQITRQDLMVILFRAFMKNQIKGGLEGFSDAMLVSEYARDAVETLVANQIISGADGKLNPLNFTTRAEVALILYRILNT